MNSLSRKINERKVFQNFAPQKKSQKVDKKKFHFELSLAKNIIALFASIMLHYKREIRDVIQSISNMNEHVFFGQIVLKIDVKLILKLKSVAFKKKKTLLCQLENQKYQVKVNILPVSRKRKSKSYKRTAKLKTNRFKLNFFPDSRDYCIEFVRTIYFPFGFLKMKKLYVPNSLIQFFILGVFTRVKENWLTF